MQASYASAAPSARLIAYWVRRKAWKPSNTVSHASCVPFSEATEARSAVVCPGQTEGSMACQAHAASLLYVHPHPTAARRAATLASSGCEMHHWRSNALRPLQRRFKARKKARGIHEYPNGLKRLKTGLQRFRTQITAFHGNGNGKGTPSGVPNLYTSANSFL